MLHIRPDLNVNGGLIEVIIFECIMIYEAEVGVGGL